MVWIGRGVIAGCLLVVLLGFSPKSDIVAHVGGFVAGTLLGTVIMRWRNFFLRRAINFGALFVTLVLLLATWWLALH
jgi:membrane associated rhomboid family serine protease